MRICDISYIIHSLPINYMFHNFSCTDRVRKTEAKLSGFAAY